MSFTLDLLAFIFIIKVCKNGKCQNMLGSFKCICDDGFSMKDKAEDGCTDDDECALDMFHCDPFAECKNTNGSYDCVCREGFTGDGFNCQVNIIFQSKRGKHVFPGYQ